MKLLTLAMVVASIATPALAQGGYSAQIASPKEPSYALLLDSVTWRCDGSACQTTSDLNGADQSDSCQDLARKVGVLQSFNGDRGAFTPKQLAACNKAAPASRTETAAARPAPPSAAH